MNGALDAARLVLRRLRSSGDETPPLQRIVAGVAELGPRRVPRFLR
jgi:hypothetical protein